MAELLPIGTRVVRLDSSGGFQNISPGTLGTVIIGRQHAFRISVEWDGVRKSNCIQSYDPIYVGKLISPWFDGDEVIP